MSARWDKIGTSGYTQVTIHHRISIFHTTHGQWRVMLYERKVVAGMIVNNAVKMAFRSSEREAKRLGQQWIRMSNNFEFAPPDGR